MKQNPRFLIFLLLFAALLLPCCSPREKGAASDTKVFFDTSVTLTIYGDEAEAALSECFDLCRNYELIYSADNKNSELSKINRREGVEVDAEGRSVFTVSDELAEAVRLGLGAWEDSAGMFDITMRPVTVLWDFRSGKGSVPDDYLLSEEVLRVGSEWLELSGNTLSVNNRNTAIDLGAVAKGCISARLKDYLRNRKGIDGAILNLGGNISVFGTKPDGTPWQIGIQKPFTERGELISTVLLEDGCVISSGVYERNFTEKGIFYHHILSPEDGMPVHSGLTQATVIGTDDALADTLSTVCMLLGKDASEALIQEKGYEVKILYTLDDGSLVLFDPESGEESVREGEQLDFRQEDD